MLIPEQLTPTCKPRCNEIAHSLRRVFRFHGNGPRMQLCVIQDSRRMLLGVMDTSIINNKSMLGARSNTISSESRFIWCIKKNPRKNHCWVHTFGLRLYCRGKHNSYCTERIDMNNVPDTITILTLTNTIQYNYTYFHWHGYELCLSRRRVQD